MTAPTRSRRPPDADALQPALHPVRRSTQSRSTSRRVHDELQGAIRDLRLTPGQLLSESDLARELHVSRTPVREAIGQLVTDGLLQVIPQVGTVVSLISMDAAEDARFMRENLEAAAFRAAVARLKSGEPAARAALATMHELLERQRSTCDDNDVDAFFTADEGLHAQVFAAGGYPGVWTQVQRAKLHLDRIRRLTLPDQVTLRDLLADHTRIVDALEARAVRDGERVVRAHAQLALQKAPLMQQLHPDYFGAAEGSYLAALGQRGSRAR